MRNEKENNKNTNEMEELEMNQEEKEIYEEYKDRINAPQEEFIKYEGPEQLLKLVMEDKKKKGWKFKDEK